MMDTQAFRKAFWERFKGSERNEPCYAYWDPLVVAEVDLCPDVEGMMSIKKQQLLNLAFGFLEEGEAYLEVGTYQGKSVVSAVLNNGPRTVYACDNFSEFDRNSFEITQGNLARYGLLDRVTFLDCDFREIFSGERLEVPIGFYFYDGAHDAESQFLAIAEVEAFLADEALVLVDDWRFAPDSQSHAKEATLRAMAQSRHSWKILYELPARFNGDRAMWWNGVGVLSFRRET